MNHLNEIIELTEEIKMEYNVTDYEALNIATKIQYNELYDFANLATENTPSALEQIAMELGAARDGNTIKEAIANLKDD